RRRPCCRPFPYTTLFRSAGGARRPVRRAVQPAGGGVSVTWQAQLLRVSPKRAPAAGEKDFPFSIPAIRTLPPLDLSARVTFFVRSEEHTSELQSRGHLVC